MTFRLISSTESVGLGQNELVRWHVAVLLTALFVSACTSDEDRSADPTPSAPEQSTAPEATTTTTVEVPLPLPVDRAEVVVGKTYVYELLTGHCGFTSLGGEIAGSYW